MLPLSLLILVTRVCFIIFINLFILQALVLSIYFLLLVSYYCLSTTYSVCSFFFYFLQVDALIIDLRLLF